MKKMAHKNGPLRLKLVLWRMLNGWKLYLPILIILAAGFFMLHNFSSQTFAYSYSSNNCTKELLILPKYSANDSPYTVSYNGGFSVAGKKIISTTSCFNMSKPISPGNNYSLKTSIFSRKYTIKTNPYPIISAQPANYLNVPTDSSISFKANVNDNTFKYILVTNNQNSLCTNDKLSLICDVKNLKLNEGQMYEATLLRQLESQQVDTVSSVALVTLDPLSVVESSIMNDSKIIDKPQNVVLSFDKELQSVAEPELSTIKSGVKQAVQVSSVAKGNQLTVSFKNELERGYDYELEIKEARGKNGEKLAAPYKLKFRTQEGPSYSGIKLRDRSLAVNQNFVVNFDQPLMQSQDISKIIKLYVEGQEHPAKYQISGTTVSLTPTKNIALCSAVSVKVNGIILNNYSVAKNNSATFNSRITCASLYSIGNSYEGRSINAYQFGSGSSVALYIGTIHGDETNAKRLLDKWIDDIEANPGRIPAGRKVIIVPLANPDGYARSTRINARSVDLNRNFGANNWKASVKMPWGATLETGGGTEPFSEPETMAIKNLIASRNPAFVMTFHSKASIVEANEAGNSVAIGNIYAKYSGYANKPASTNTSTFNYDTTGSLEEWGKDKLNLPIILVELATRSDDEFYRNKEALYNVL